MTEVGVKAIDKYNLPAFIDGSCRREPDFENYNPSITALCRQNQFAPKLLANDIIVYITVKGEWFKDFEHYRLVGYTGHIVPPLLVMLCHLKQM